MRGLMADPSGKIIDLPITANFREGLSVSDYFISSHGARKGLTDTALRTADSGYLTRRLVDVAQDVIVRSEDCDVEEVNLKLVRAQLSAETYDSLEQLNEELQGRVLAADVYSSSGAKLVKKDSVLDTRELELIGAHRVGSLELRGVSLTRPNSASHSLVKERILLGSSCAAERAQRLARFKAEYIGKELAEGILGYSKGATVTGCMLEEILQSEERQLKVRHNHVRGIEVEAITEGRGVIESLEDRLIGRVLAEDVYDKQGRLVAKINSSIDKEMAEMIGSIRNGNIMIAENGTLATYHVHDRLQGKELGEDIYDCGELILRKGTFISSETLVLLKQHVRCTVRIRSVLTCKSPFGVCIKCYGSDLANQRPVEVGEAVGIIAAQSIGEPGTQLTMRTFHTGGVAGGDDITQGLPRVEELFEARKPKHNAIISEVGGEVRFGKNEKNNLVQITVTPTLGSSREYTIPYGARISVTAGERIDAGTKLTEGSVNPHDILRVNGLKATQQYLVYEVQKVYKSQGVEINDKHIEVMVRQMLHKVKIEDSGNTEFLPGEFIDINVFEAANTKVIEAGGEPAVAKPILLGITKASLATDSFLSAASFQETTRVLTGWK